jgi:hypothetical protein
MSFDVKPKKIIIPPLNEKRVKIFYIPSLLNEDECGEVVFTSEDIGQWIFKVRGKGKKPT